MLKEVKAIEYAFEVIRILHHNGEHDSKEVYRLIDEDKKIEVSLSYVQKVLPRMVKLGIVRSSGNGYTLAKPAEEITVNTVLDLCDMPEETEPLFNLCRKIKAVMSTISITEIYNIKE